MILERDQFKAPLPYVGKNVFLRKQTVGVGNQGQPGVIGSELPENRVAPVAHRWVPQHQSSSTRCGLAAKMVNKSSESSMSR